MVTARGKALWGANLTEMIVIGYEKDITLIIKEELQRQNPAGKSVLPAEGEQTVGTGKQAGIELGLRRYSDTQSAIPRQRKRPWPGREDADVDTNTSDSSRSQKATVTHSGHGNTIVNAFPETPSVRP